MPDTELRHCWLYIRRQMALMFARISHGLVIAAISEKDRI